MYQLKSLREYLRHPASQSALLVSLLIGGLPSPAWAIKPFADEFEAVYVQGNQNAAFVAAVKAAKCNLCHVAGKDKKSRNAYGEELAKLLDKKADAKNPAKIKASLEKVAGLKEPGGQTFGDLIKEGKLPGG